MKEIPSRAEFGFSLGDSDLHRKLLFGRAGRDRQTIQQVRFAKRRKKENRISLRDGLKRRQRNGEIAILGDLEDAGNHQSVTRNQPRRSLLHTTAKNNLHSGPSPLRLAVASALHLSGRMRRRGEGSDSPLLSPSGCSGEFMRTASALQFRRHAAGQGTAPHLNS